MTENHSVCAKCGDKITQFDPDGGLWVGSLGSGGSYDCSGGLHEPSPPAPPPVWVREDENGYLHLHCPECLTTEIFTVDRGLAWKRLDVVVQADGEIGLQEWPDKNADWETDGYICSNQHDVTVPKWLTDNIEYM